MSVSFARRLERMPHYEAGLDAGAARERFGTDDAIKLASNETPFGPPEPVLDAIARAAPRLNRYPEQLSPSLRRALAERYESDPARIAVGNGSCEILLAACVALCEPGAEIVFAWPAFSMYPHLAALSEAREVRVPLAPGGVHDLEAMLAEVTAATQMVLVCNPNNPTGTYLDAERIGAFVERVPDHVTVILDEAYIELQTTDDPDRTLELLAAHPNLVVLRTFSKVYGLAGLRCGYAIGSPRFRAAVDAVRQPFSVNSLAQVAAAEALRHQDEVAARVERTVAERAFVEAALAEVGLEPVPSQANFSWIPLPDAQESDVVERLGHSGVVVRPGSGLGGPGHIRVTYGTRAENERFRDALAAALA